MKKWLTSLFVIMIISFSLISFSKVVTAESAVIGSGTFGEDNLEWSLTSDGVLNISGTGKIPDYFYGSRPWLECGQTEPYYDDKGERCEDLFRCSFIKQIVIEEGITEIGDYAFECLTSVTDVHLPESLNSIGCGIFGWCESLKNINLPAGVKSGNILAFRYCRSLESVTIPNATWLNQFGYCDALKSIKIPITDSVPYYPSVKEIYYPGNAASWKNVSGSSKYSAATKHYYYNYKSMMNCRISTAYASYGYTGKEIKPTVTVRTASGTKLTKGTHYTVSYENNVDFGTATIIVTGIGKYYDQKTYTFKIKPAKVKNLQIESKTDSSATITWSPSTGATKYLIYNGKDLVGNTTSTTCTLRLSRYSKNRTWVYAIVIATDENGDTVEYKSNGSDIYLTP